MDVHLRAAGEAVAVRVQVQGVGAVRDVLPVGESVVVAVGVERVRAERDFVTVAEAVTSAPGLANAIRGSAPSRSSEAGAGDAPGAAASGSGVLDSRRHGASKA